VATRLLRVTRGRHWTTDRLYHIFPISKEWQGYVNLKGYGEFAAQNRAEGWNAWLTFVISPAAPGEAPPSARRMITK